MRPLAINRERLVLTENTSNDGQIMLWDLGDLDTDRPLNQQLWELKEDLAQIQYRHNTTLDIGWYPEFSPSGPSLSWSFSTQIGMNPFIEQRPRP
jgi:hypothetical protein